MYAIMITVCLAAVTWQHPAGLITNETLDEIKGKLAGQAWARAVYEGEKRDIAPWLDLPYADLQRFFPKTCGNVYHNFSCPNDRSRLTFDPFKDDAFTCPSCGKTFAADTDPGVYGAEERYHGTMHDGWECMFYQKACTVAISLAVAGLIDGSEAHLRRGVDLLMLYADTIAQLPTQTDPTPAMSRILTYHREGDNKILNDLAVAYELLRIHMSEAQRTRFQEDVLKRMLDDTLFEPIYTIDWNNVYQWHRTMVQTALALEREDLIDWTFGYGPYDPEHQPEHRSVRRLAANHFKPDGAYWELCSGYHLYPVFFFCELAVVSRNLSRMDPDRFPPLRYDLTDTRNEQGAVIKAALEWFVSMAPPDRMMPTVGDSMAPRAGLTDYYATAEAGYRYYDVAAVGDYEALRTGARSWAALLYGASEIVQKPTSCTSSNLSSGWVALRNTWRGNQVWAGLNGLIPGGGHQHADRLTLLLYSCGKLLTLEKATPYNESVTRVLGTLSQSHNTVTVDRQSQPQGESLKPEQVPALAFFFAPALVQFAELRADRLYGNTSLYRRAVALVEDVAVDLFRVEGGAAHDWMVNLAGDTPTLSLATDEAPFEPADWLYNGTNRVGHAATDGLWDARWRVDDVTSRFTMLPAKGTEVFTLETFPLDNAVITPEHPPCRTLCVRRTTDIPYLTVWDAWREAPNLQTASPGSAPESLRLATASNVYYLLFGPGESRFEDGASLQSDAPFALVRAGTGLAYVGGTALEFVTPSGTLRMTSDAAASVAAEYQDGIVTLDVAGDIQYDTDHGQDVPRAVPKADVTFEGNLWTVRETRPATPAGMVLSRRRDCRVTHGSSLKGV
jgi:hypothetical protein